jgi:hypothetical protein
VCASPSNQVNFHEAPGAADLECRNLTRGSQGPQSHRMYPQNGGGLEGGKKRIRDESFDRAVCGQAFTFLLSHDAYDACSGLRRIACVCAYARIRNKP